MPIIHTGQVQYILMSLAVDMESVSASVVFHTRINGQKVGEVGIGIPTEPLMGILAATPTAGKNRADDVTDAIYEYAISVGAIVSGSS